jgi:hypothetical protein
MPYSTKLLTQEQETYLNLSMRYITSSGVQKLTPLEESGESSAVAEELPRLLMPAITVPAYVKPVEEKKFTIEELDSMEASIAEKTKPEGDVLLEEIDLEQETAPVMTSLMPVQMVPVQNMTQVMPTQGLPQGLPQVMPQQVMTAPLAMINLPPTQMGMTFPAQPQNEVVYPSEIAMPAPARAPLQRITQGDGVLSNTIPGQNGPMLVVDTSGNAMAQMGLEQNNVRRIRTGFRNQESGPTFSSVMPPQGGVAAGKVTINKME